MPLLAPLATSSFLNTLDPRLRVLLCLAWTGSCLSLERLSLQALAALAALGVALLLGLSPRALLRRLVVMEGFMLLVLLLLPFSMPGNPVFTLGNLEATDAGFARALGILFQAHGVIFMVLILLGTLEVVTLGHALARLGVPDKLVHLLLFTVRYVQVLYEEHLRLRQAMRARAFVPGTNRHSWNSLGWLLGMLLVRSLERASRIHEAMKCRGFHGRFYLLDDGAWGRHDTLIALAAVPLVLVLPLLESVL
nr:cobalt ECF transporter T component CbiQ [Motiliproteus sp. SC1-56]